MLSFLVIYVTFYNEIVFVKYVQITNDDIWKSVVKVTLDWQPIKLMTFVQ